MYDEGFAPELLEVKVLKGSWLAVVMEYIVGTRVSNGEVEDYKQFLVRNTLPKLRERKYVHGDLQLANIIKHNDKFILLDYDWSGEA